MADDAFRALAVSLFNRLWSGGRSESATDPWDYKAPRGWLDCPSPCARVRLVEHGDMEAHRGRYVVFDFRPCHHVYTTAGGTRGLWWDEALGLVIARLGPLAARAGDRIRVRVDDEAAEYLLPYPLLDADGEPIPFVMY